MKLFTSRPTDLTGFSELYTILLFEQPDLEYDSQSPSTELQYRYLFLAPQSNNALYMLKCGDLVLFGRGVQDLGYILAIVSEASIDLYSLALKELVLTNESVSVCRWKILQIVERLLLLQVRRRQRI